MKRRPHWTVFAVCGLALLTVGAVISYDYSFRRTSQFEDAINEAGGAVHYDGNFSRSFEIGGTIYYLSDRKPVAVEISSGSHPIPRELSRLRSMKTVKRLTLTTSAVGDYLVPLLSTFRHLTMLDLTKTEISAGAVIRILEALPGLKEIRLSRENFSETQFQELLAHRLSGKVVLAGPDS